MSGTFALANVPVLRDISILHNFNEIIQLVFRSHGQYNDFQLNIFHVIQVTTEIYFNAFDRRSRI